MNISEISVTNETWNFIWHTFANVSLTYDLVSSQNATKGTSEDATFAFENPAKLGILTGLLITCLADFRIATPKLDDNLDSKLKAMAMTLVNLTVFFLLAPIITSILAVLFAYRKIVQLVLMLTLKGEFAGLLAGADCVWSLEDSAALSVINVLGIFEKNSATTNESFLMNFRRVMEKCLLLPSLEKLNWTREKKYGYCYWRSGRKIRVEEHVRWMEDEEGDERCNDSCQDVERPCLNDTLKKLTNTQLPMEHSTSWEILVGRNWTKSSRNCCEMENDLAGFEGTNLRDETTIPVLFRVHHSVGDGVALLRLLLESIADSKSELNDEEQRISVPRLRESFSVTGVVRTEREILYNDKHLFDATMPFATRIPIRAMTRSILSYLDDRSKILKCRIMRLRAAIEGKGLERSWDTLAEKILDGTKNWAGSTLKMFWVIVSAPNCLIQQALRSMDNSALHGPPLSGEKLLSCWMESDFRCSRNSNLLAKIRDIKNATGSRFGDVVLAALSENLRRHYSKIGEAAPKTMTAVLPARMTAPSKKLNLQNDFSVGLLTLCCNEVSGELSDENTRLFERIEDVARSSKKLRNDPDYLINFYVMNWLSALLPEYFLKPVLESHSTLVFSNLPGPQEISIIDHKLRNIAFWIPHRGKTGLGCSLLTYGGKIHLSISADTALIRSQNLLDEIVRSTIEDIDKFYDSISFTCATFRI